MQWLRAQRPVTLSSSKMMSKVIIFGLLALGMSVTDAADESTDPFGPDYMLKFRLAFRNSLDTECQANVTDEIKEDVTNNMMGKGFDCFKYTMGYWTDFIQDIAEVKSKGNNSEAVIGLCTKAHQLIDCYKKMAEIMAPCADDDAVNLANQQWDLMYEFPCGNSGERLTRFFTEGGLDCLEKTREILTQETRLKFKKFFEDNGISSASELRKIKVEKQCGLYDDILVSVVHAFENCTSTYPTNIAKDFSKSFRKLLKCPEKSDEVVASTTGSNL